MAHRQVCLQCLRAVPKCSSGTVPAMLLVRTFATSAYTRSDASTSTSASGNEKSPLKSNSAPRPPPLPRPLGLPRAPQKHVKPSLRERTTKMMDQDARMAERKHLVKEASTGYFEDYNKIRHHGGKSWIAPKTLIQEKVCK